VTELAEGARTSQSHAAPQSTVIAARAGRCPAASTMKPIITCTTKAEAKMRRLSTVLARPTSVAG
jgi:hypothetical protein